DPSLRCDDVITALEEFKYGSIKEKVGHLEFELERDPESFFILKTFSNNYPPYSTMRYYALKKDEKYEERRKVKFI
ncbi:MAG: hypothetical protein IKG55_08715, partial [Solobacterium sp.]|nr:hypothetical protein [Erysipelotrichaceae bacterium]MBR3350140.1 hypothetical protein [Solobacterium sp.]